MKINKKQFNKYKRKFKKKVKKFFAYDHNSPQVINFFFIFLIGISLVYAFLIFAMTERVKQECDLSDKKAPPTKFEREISEMVKGRPIERMVPYIAQENKEVATYLLAIAKKESDWGKFSPKNDGRECWNYWGYRGSENKTDSGYSCFYSPRHAVHVVGNRVEKLIKEENINTPRKMAVWKCGYDCSWDNPEAVDKWVKDVGFYYNKIYKEQ